MLSTDKQTDKLTNTTKNITSFAKEVIAKEVIKWEVCQVTADGQLYPPSGGLIGYELKNTTRSHYKDDNLYGYPGLLA